MKPAKDHLSPLFATALLVAVFVILLPGAADAWSRTVEWQDLIDPVSGVYDDPFAALSPSQLRSLGIVLRARQELKKSGLSAEERAALKADLARHEALLQVAGVDADGLLAQREDVAREKAEASLAVNPAMEGKDIRIDGYVIPLFDETGADLGGYLVPRAGMCSHIPPPAPNQLIYFPPGSAWQGAYVYQPVELRGRLRKKLSRKEIHLLDGQVQMISALNMQVSSVKVLDPAGPKASERSFDLFSPFKRSMKRFFGAPAGN